MDKINKIIDIKRLFNNVLLTLILITHTAIAQKNIQDIEKIVQAQDSTKELVLKPTIGVGIGSMKFYGDLLSRKYGNPIIGRFGYELNVSDDISPYFRLKFYVLWGKISANERYPARNLNFISKISTGGLMMEYNFGHFLPEKRKVSPYITAGIESFEFHSKTDLYDQYGNKYHYWSDGSIRNMPEDDPLADQAIRLQRDYFYETDLRELNLDGLGKYPERTWAIPFGVGIKFHLSQDVDFVFSTTMHWTFSDLVDNVSYKSDSRMNIPHTKSQDKVLYTGVSLHYNLQWKIKKKNEPVQLDQQQLLAIKDGDFDGDGVNDWIDKCHLTPPGVKVDQYGCPIDTDKDRIPDYRDEELLTREGAPVLANGVEFTDSLILLDYLAYMDTTGFFGAETIFKKIADESYKKKKRYQVKIGEYKTEIDPELANKILSIPDAQIQVFGDTLSVITVGNYKSLPEAVKRKIALTLEGFPVAEVVEKNEKGELKSSGDEANNLPVNVNEIQSVKSSIPIFRIQLGVFSQKQPKNNFTSLDNVLEIPVNGKYKYIAGSFENYDEAVKYLNQIKNNTIYKDAFIVAFKDGNQVSLSSLGIQAPVDESKLPKEKEVSTSEDINYYVQLGIFRYRLPNETLQKYLQLGNVKMIKEGDLARYVYGKYKTFAEANRAKQELLQKGFEGAFIIAYKKNQMISVREAMEITDK